MYLTSTVIKEKYYTNLREENVMIGAGTSRLGAKH